MGLREVFGKKPKRFVTPESARVKLAEQLEDNETAVTRLAAAGVSPEDAFRLEYFFYSDTPQKGKSLASDLARLGYEVEYRPSTKREGETLITGWTTPMSLSLPVVNGWTQHMAQLSVKYDCDFAGWDAGGIG